MAKATKKQPFDVQEFLHTVASGRTVSNYRKNRKVFSQGDPGDAVFYIQEGKVKVCVVSEQGKEAVVALHGNGDFFGESCLNGHPLRVATVVTVTECVIMRLEKAAIVRVLHDEPKFSEMFMAHLLSRNARVEEDLVDQLFNSSEKRLARVLLLMANFGKESKARAGHSEDKPGDTRGDGRNHQVARQHVHEQVPQAWVHQIQRITGGP
ncbi:CRP/FNR family cyclic AMP-dependent transcriptional regulator [Bradyrhizobium japonicum]